MKTTTMLGVAVITLVLMRGIGGGVGKTWAWDHYDADGDGFINRSEALEAALDYDKKRTNISKRQALAVIRAFVLQTPRPV